MRVPVADEASNGALTIRRRRCGRGFVYLAADGTSIRDAAILERIRKLAIPPAYEDVRIAEDADAPLQAVGRDAAGRLQYRYHTAWEAEREARKAQRLRVLVRALSRIRSAVRRDIATSKPSRARAVACAVAIIDATHIRVGGESYARSSGARGATTLLKQQVRFSGNGVTLSFRGKRGIRIRCAVTDRTLINALRRIALIRGNRLLQYVGEDSVIRSVNAADVNRYLKSVSGCDITAKDFRMLAASAKAAEEFASMAPGESESARRRQIAEVMRSISADLANTPAVARKSYVHGLVTEAFLEGTLADALRHSRSGPLRTRAENALARVLEVMEERIGSGYRHAANWA